jgi:hypothetical protein
MSKSKVFTLKFDTTISEKTIALNAPHRKLTGLVEGDQIDITPCIVDDTIIIQSVIIEVNAYKSKPPTYSIDCDLLEIEFKEKSTL